jgi:putative membrane protein
VHRDRQQPSVHDQRLGLLPLARQRSLAHLRKARALFDAAFVLGSQCVAVAGQLEPSVARRAVIGVVPMNRAFTRRRLARLGFIRALLMAAAGGGIANAQTVAPTEAPGMLNAVDFNFVGQANLGAPFQVDSGRIAEAKSTSAAIRDYAHLMVTSHIPVVDSLNAILQRKNVIPSNTLLHGAYDAMLFTLKADRGTAFDRNYVNGQVEYQKGNAALFKQEIQSGNDPDLRQFARETLPKIEDHLQRAVKLASAVGTDSTD